LGRKAVEKAVGATFSIGPKGLFYGLVSKFSRILLVERLGGKYPSQSPIGTQGHRKVPQGHFIKCDVVQKIDHSPVGRLWLEVFRPNNIRKKYIAAGNLLQISV
jgi:hypothetical protein